MIKELSLSISQLLGISTAISFLVVICICALWTIWLNRIKEGQKAEFQKQIEKQKSEFTKEIENLKAKNEKLNYISKTQFDAEFKIYRELSEYCYYMFFYVSQLFPKGIVDRPTDPEELQKYINTLYEKALNALVDFQNILYKDGASITEDLYKIFDNFKVKNQEQVNMYKNINIADIEEVRAEFRKCFHSECIKRTEEIYKDYDKITIELRKYLKSLKVQEV